MKMVSAAKLRRGQNYLDQARPYFNRMESMVNKLFAAVGDDYKHVLTERREEINNVAVIVLAGDKGLCGAFNSHILKKAELYIREIPKNFPDADYEIVALGNKSADYFKKHAPDKIADKYEDIFKSIDFERITAILQKVVEGYIEGKYDKVVFFYTDFLNVIRQEPQSKEILPFIPKIEEEAETNSNYIYEPDKKGILDSILPLYIDALFRTYYLSANTAIQAARMMAMDNATTNAEEIIEVLQLEYNKERQASITGEMLEIVSGADALGG